MTERDLFDQQQPPKGNTIAEICASIGIDYGAPAWHDRFGQALLHQVDALHGQHIRTLSLFSGAGGLDIGFHDLGFDIVAQVEIEERFCRTLWENMGEGRHFPHSEVNCVDIRRFTGEGLGPIDFIIGGPPCQTFSAAGRRASGVVGTSDERGVLFREYVRLLETLRPKGFLFENVYGIIGAQGGAAWEEIKQSFAQAGYRLFHRIVDSADYGVPQHRERLIIVGIKEGEFLFPRPTHGVDSIDRQPHFTASKAIEGLQLTEEEKKTGINGKFGHLIDDIPPGLNYSFYTAEMGHPHPLFAWRSKFSDFMYKADPEMPVRTIKAQGGQYTGPLHWDGRHFAVSEYKRLQTFPDNYTIVGNRQTAIQQIGNSVPPQLARMLALAVRIQVFGTVFPFRLDTLPQQASLSFRSNKRALTAHYREKAHAAIRRLYPSDESRQPEDETFYITLTDKFRYITSDHQGDYHVKTEWGERLTIDVESVRESDTPVSLLHIKSRKGWTLPVDSVEMRVHSNDWFAITVAWRVLDHLLSAHGLKADLVQLNGYYQYESNLDCQLTSNILGHAHILDNIINGQAVGKNLTTAQMADLLAIDEQEVMPVGKWLRRLGYEIRNSHTNPQIGKDMWLIPYKFPTLLPESVQLYKTLE